MNKCKALHETGLRDIVDLIGLAKDIAYGDAEDILDSTKRSPWATTSIAKLSSNLVLVFPVIVSRNLSIEAAAMTAKAIERKCVVMLQLLFSSFQLTDAESAVEFISQFHKNIKVGEKITVDDVVYAMDKLSESSVVTCVNPKQVKAIQEDMKNIFFYFEENTSSKSLNSYDISHDRYGGNVIKEARNGGSLSKAGIDRRSMYRSAKDGNEMFSKQLLDTDIKKANELVPSLLVVNLTSKNENNEPVDITNIVIGVKARMIPMDSDDIINHVITKVQDKNWLLQFIRATTREISFFKDFLFAIDRAKIDALAHSRRGSSNPMWKVLERRAMVSKWKRFIGKPNDVSAITTIVVSQEEVDYVRKEHNMDFENYSTIAPVMEAYNLMGFVIVDESLEVAKFLFDTGEGTFENLSFTNLERENSDNSYKKIVNLMTKISR